MFDITVPLWELVLRGTATYWFLFLIFRFVLRRDVGSLALADVLVLMLVADASQNAMSGGYQSLPEGAVVVGTIVGWNFLLDWASFHLPQLRRLAEPPPLKLVHHGRILWRNMRKEFLNRDDLYSKLREHGVEDLSTVKAAFMEGDGEVTVITYRRRGARR